MSTAVHKYSRAISAVKSLRESVTKRFSEVMAEIDKTEAELTELLKSTESLQGWRWSKGWSQRDLAGKVGVSNMTISHWENGTSTPSEENKKALRKLGFKI